MYARFSPASNKLRVFATNSDWFMVQFAPVVIGQSNYLFTFRESFENRINLLTNKSPKHSVQHNKRRQEIQSGVDGGTPLAITKLV